VSTPARRHNERTCRARTVRLLSEPSSVNAACCEAFLHTVLPGAG